MKNKEGRALLTVSMPQEMKREIMDAHARLCEKAGCKVPLSQFLQKVIREYIKTTKG